MYFQIELLFKLIVAASLGVWGPLVFFNIYQNWERIVEGPGWTILGYTIVTFIVFGFTVLAPWMEVVGFFFDPDARKSLVPGFFLVTFAVEVVLYVPFLIFKLAKSRTPGKHIGVMVQVLVYVLLPMGFGMIIIPYDRAPETQVPQADLTSPPPLSPHVPITIGSDGLKRYRGISEKQLLDFYELKEEDVAFGMKKYNWTRDQVFQDLARED